jgi:hypothetical protein
MSYGTGTHADIDGIGSQRSIEAPGHLCRTPPGTTL